VNPLYCLKEWRGEQRFFTPRGQQLHHNGKKFTPRGEIKNWPRERYMGNFAKNAT
jgi:hypothetical protein